MRLFDTVAGVIIGLAISMLLYLSCTNKQESIIESEEVVAEDTNSFRWVLSHDTAFIYGNCNMPNDWFGFHDYHNNYNDSITVIVMENTVRHIREDIFEKCSNLICFIYGDNVYTDWKKFFYNE